MRVDGENIDTQDGGAAIEHMANTEYEITYDGARAMLLVDDADSRAFLTGLFDAMYDELPFPKVKKKK